MIIRIDDSVFTVDESEAYTVLRLIKKVLIPKQESFQGDVDNAVAKANEALNKATDNSEAIESIEDELEGINETTIPNIKEDITSLETTINLVGGQVTAMQGDVEHLITEDIPMLNADLVSIGQSLNNKVDKYAQRTEQWDIMWSLNGLEEGYAYGADDFAVKADVTVQEVGNVVFFSCLWTNVFTWRSTSGSTNFAIKIPDTNVVGLSVSGCIGNTTEVTAKFARLEEPSNRYIVVANNSDVVAGWYGSGIISAEIIGGTSYHFSGFYIKGV